MPQEQQGTKLVFFLFSIAFLALRRQMLMFYIQKWAIHQFRTWPSWLNDRSGFVVWPKIHVNWSFRLSSFRAQCWQLTVVKRGQKFCKHFESTPGPWLVRFFFRSGKNLHEPNPQHFKSLVTKNALVKEFLDLCSENCISWIFGLFFWKCT